MIEADHHPSLHVDFGKFLPKLASYVNYLFARKLSKFKGSSHEMKSFNEIQYCLWIMKSTAHSRAFSRERSTYRLGCWNLTRGAFNLINSPYTPASSCQYRCLIMSTADVTNLSRFQKLGLLIDIGFRKFWLISWISIFRPTRNLVPVFCKPIAYLFNLSITECFVPQQWKIIIVI